MRTLLLIISILVTFVRSEAQSVYTEPNGQLRVADIVPIPITADSTTYYISRVYATGKRIGDNMELSYGLQYNAVQDSAHSYWITFQDGSVTLPYNSAITGDELETLAFQWIQTNGCWKLYPFIKFKIQYK